MTYIKRTDLTALEGETVVELDTGDLVAVKCTVERSDTGVAFMATARAIHEDGEPVLDAVGNPIQTAFPLSVPADRLDANLARDCMLAVLGEPITRDPPWSEVTLSRVSIRVSLAAAPMVGNVDAGAVL